MKKDAHTDAFISRLVMSPDGFHVEMALFPGHGAFSALPGRGKRKETCKGGFKSTLYT